MSNNTKVECPNCQEVFNVDDAVYNNIVKQVRDQQFDEELKNRLDLAERQNTNTRTNHLYPKYGVDFEVVN